MLRALEPTKAIKCCRFVLLVPRLLGKVRGRNMPPEKDHTVGHINDSYINDICMYAVESHLASEMRACAESQCVFPQWV